MIKTAIVIPALNPDSGLLELVHTLGYAWDRSIVVVDDGSSSASSLELLHGLARERGCTVLRHQTNRGKGAALKTGIAYAQKTFPELGSIITADADGQHLAADIIRMCVATAGHPGSIVLGTRDLSGKTVPFKSRWGNRITSVVFGLTTHVSCADTQTGLRGFPAQLAEFCLSVPGERYEYEMNVLVAAAEQEIPFFQLPISTVYLAQNRSSHFRAVRDSARIYYHLLRQFFRFGSSSLLCAIVDVGLFTVLTGDALLGGSPRGILWSTVAARCISGILNFTLNKKWSFASGGSGLRQGLGYLALFCTQMLLSSSVVTLLSALPVGLTPLKLITDCCLFAGSYYIQKNIIFKSGRPRAAQ